MNIVSLFDRSRPLTQEVSGTGGWMSALSKAVDRASAIRRPVWVSQGNEGVLVNADSRVGELLDKLDIARDVGSRGL